MTRRRWLAVCAAILALALAQRIWNLCFYPPEMGFDADGNWQYIQSLILRWHVPAVDEFWSACHPPFFYAVGAAAARMFGMSGTLSVPDQHIVSYFTMGLGSLAGVAAALYTALYIWRRMSPDPLRVAIALFVVLFAPVHIYMSAMLGEELFETALMTFAIVGLAWEASRAEGERSVVVRPALFGVLAGLALLTKLTGATAVAAGGLFLLSEGPARGWRKALASTVAFGVAATAAGGWYYLRNWWLTGALYPYMLPMHASVMLQMPPGSRDIFDYLRFPLASFDAVEASDPALLHSVWGTMWTSVWFDSQRGFIPLHPTKGLVLIAHVLLVGALVPTAAFFAGFVRGLRRAIAGSAPDRVLVGFSVLLVAGYVAFTWRNPWFASAKGSYLLGISAPYAIYASEALAPWMEARAWRTWIVAATFGVMIAATTVAFSYNAWFQKTEFSGTEWQKPAP